MIKVGRLKDTDVAREYMRRIIGERTEWKKWPVEEAQSAWENMKVKMKEIAREVCGRRVVGRVWKGIVWWNEDLERLCKEKKSLSSGWETKRMQIEESM